MGDGLADSPRLAELAESLERHGWAAELFDADWRLVWVSPELRKLVGEEDEELLGYGQHIVPCRLLPTWQRTTTDEHATALAAETIGWAVRETPGGGPGLLAQLGAIADIGEVPEDIRTVLAEADPPPPEPLRPFHFDFVQGELPPLPTNGVVVRVREPDGELVGRALLYGLGMAASLGALVARGDRGMFERMASLIEPAPREAAVLFADLQGSGSLSRRLSSASFFRLIGRLTTGLDDLVIRNGGIVGKHAGDGVTAFFLSEHLGSASAAARGAIDTARGIAEAAADAAREESVAEPVLMNVGVHWGGALYMGQLVTGGRLEVTALGDEVNETARLQQVARDGAVIASKILIERLSPDDAGALGLDPAAFVYRPLAELPGAEGKAARDAGSVSVTEL